MHGTMSLKLGEGVCYSYTCAMCYLDLTESHEVQLFEKMVSGKRFGHKRHEVICN